MKRGAKQRQEFREHGSFRWKVTLTFSFLAIRDRCCARYRSSLAIPSKRSGGLAPTLRSSHPLPEAIDGIFSEEGEFWTIACRGEVFRIRDVRGLAYIAYLLGHPGEEFHVLSLASKVGGTVLA